MLCSVSVLLTTVKTCNKKASSVHMLSDKPWTEVSSLRHLCLVSVQTFKRNPHQSLFVLEALTWKERRVPWNSCCSLHTESEAPPIVSWVTWWGPSAGRGMFMWFIFLFFYTCNCQICEYQLSVGDSIFLGGVLTFAMWPCLNFFGFSLGWT